VNPQGLRFVGCIHRDSYYARARRPDFQVVRDFAFARFYDPRLTGELSVFRLLRT
jgi:hypothetical protein